MPRAELTAARTVDEPVSLEETLITIFCLVEALSASPFIARTLFGWMIGDQAKATLLSINKNPNFWVMAPLTPVALWIFYKVITRRRVNLPAPQLTNDQRVELAVQNFKRKRRISNILRVINSLGFVLIKEWMLGRMGVATYGTFRRPPTWPKAPDRYNRLDRINFDGGEGAEFQYSKDFKHLIVRAHSSNSDTYGPEVIRRPTPRDVRLLMIASIYFPWWFVCHLFRRMFG